VSFYKKKSEEKIRSKHLDIGSCTKNTIAKDYQVSQGNDKKLAREFGQLEF